MKRTLIGLLGLTCAAWLGLFALLTAPPPGAASARVFIEQRALRFETQTLDVSAGTVLRFFNADPVEHNVMVLKDGTRLEDHYQAPGSATDIAFDEAGFFKVRCAIHPRMALDVTVTDR
ncbi:MAG: plastocyanin/azurin family copper-binding protein [Maricaulaceae bacterium]